MYDFNVLVGYCAAVLTTVAFIPQVVHTLKYKDTGSLSLSMYIIFFVGVVLWLVYGVLNDDFPIIIANSITGFLAFIILFMKIRNDFF